MSDSYVDWSSSLILIELDSVAHNDIAFETEKHSKKSRETGNENKRKSLVTHEDCCNHYCLSHFTASEVTVTSEYFKSKGVTDQNQFLLDSLKVMLNQESTNHDICGNIIQCKPVVRSLSSKAIEGKTWMARYFDRIGDSLPHMDQIHFHMVLQNVTYILS